jgi:hypothetical protein
LIIHVWPWAFARRGLRVEPDRIPRDATGDSGQAGARRAIIRMPCRVFRWIPRRIGSSWDRTGNGCPARGSEDSGIRG